MTQISENKDAVSKLKEDTAALKKRQNVLVGSETGNPVSCNDAYSAPLCGLTVYGKSTQDGTPSPDNPVPIVSAGDGGSVAVKVTGKNLLDDGIIPSQINQLTIKLDLAQNKTYTLSNNLPNRSDGGAFLFFLRPSEEANSAKNGVTQGKPVTLTTGSDGKALILFNNTGDTLISDFKAYWYQLELGSTATTYSPYRKQLLTLPTPNGLPGIPVTSGGNYTDPSGQQWVCDEVDLERGVKVQRVKVLDINNTSLMLRPSSNSYWYVSRILSDCSLNNTGTKSYKAVMCQKFPVVSQSDETKYSYPIVAPYGHIDKVELRFRAPEALYATIEDFRQTIVGTKVYYPLATPVETPLTPAEIAAYKALTAYAPDTVVQASDGAGIKLDYQRDVNLVVKNLEDAIASMTTT